MPRFPADDLYARLGVPSTAGIKEIQKAWRARMQAIHPDRRPGDLNAHAEAVRLNEAREILTDRLRRADYDLYRRTQRRSQTSGASSSARGPRREPPPPPPPPPSSPPSPPRVVLEPPIVDFGAIQWGDGPADQRLTIRMSDGSPLPRVAVRHHWGRFWTNRQYEDALGRRTFTVIFEGRGNANLGPGPHQDVAEVAVGDQLFIVRLRIVIEWPATRQARSAPPPPPPRQAQPDPAEASAPEASNSDEAVPPRGGGRTKHPLGLVLLVLAVLIGVGVWATTNVLGKGSPLAATGAPQPSPYCKITSAQGVEAFYRVGMGTEQATGPALWDSMATPPSDPFVSWWTTSFPHWERANRYAGFTWPTVDHPFAKYESIELSAIATEGWRPVPDAFQTYPWLNAKAEAAQRHRFLSEWVKYLDSPTCRRPET